MDAKQYLENENRYLAIDLELEVANHEHTKRRKDNTMVPISISHLKRNIDKAIS